MQAPNLTLYLLVLVLIAGVVVAALGGGFLGQQQPWPLQWQHQAFAHSCHQIPERSFWTGGQPMAVCSRCLGIYAGFASGWLLLPAIPFKKIFHFLSFKKVLFVTALINMADIAGNSIGFWENTLTSRLVLGCVLGMAAAILFSGVFFNKKIKSTENHYGKITASGI